MIYAFCVFIVIYFLFAVFVCIDIIKEEYKAKLKQMNSFLVELEEDLCYLLKEPLIDDIHDYYRLKIIRYNLLVGIKDVIKESGINDVDLSLEDVERLIIAHEEPIQWIDSNEYVVDFIEDYSEVPEDVKIMLTNEWASTFDVKQLDFMHDDIISNKVDIYINNIEVNRENGPLGSVKDYDKLFK